MKSNIAFKSTEVQKNGVFKISAPEVNELCIYLYEASEKLKEEGFNALARRALELRSQYNVELTKIGMFD